MKIINAPSLANCGLLEMGEQVEQLVQGGVQWFHIDMMDGHYVPNFGFGFSFIQELKQKYPQVDVDVHLMITQPLSYLPQLKQAGADWVSFHMDATNFSRRTLTTIRDMGMKAGIVINPSQRIDIIEPIIDFVDYVVLMTVEPGYAGQKFMVDALPRVSELVALRKKYQKDFLISIDGGVDYPNAIACVKRGAEVYVTGIYTVFRQPEPLAEACRKFQRTMEEAAQEG